MNVVTPVPLIYTREHIEAGLGSMHARWLDGLLDPGPASWNRQRLVLGFHGYNGHSDQVFEEPRVRQWMRDLDHHWPFWFYFLNPDGPSLLLLTLLLCPLERTAHALHLADHDYQQFLRTHFAAMDALSAALGDSHATRTAMKEAIRHALL